MGADFLEATAKPFRKAVSRDAAAVARMGLRCGITSREIFVATLLSSTSGVHIHDDLVAEVSGPSVKLTCGLHEVARIDTPPPALLNQLIDVGGYGAACVQKINPISETIDVEIH